MSTTLFRRAAAVLTMPLLLAGCRSGYDVDVRNLTDQPITAKLTAPHTDGAPMTLAERYVGPGDRGHLFKQTDSGARVSLAVDFAGNVGYPAMLDLGKGQTIVNVRRAETGPQGRLQLEEIPRP
jgi:hypothetical protein